MPSKNEKVLVTGITGFIGSHIAVSLLNLGYSVRGTMRNLLRKESILQTISAHIENSDHLDFAKGELTNPEDWEKAMAQSQSMEERMDMFLDTVEDVASQDVEMSKAGEVITDEEIDRMIEAESEAEHQRELGKLAGLRAELNSLKSEGEKQK